MRSILLGYVKSDMAKIPKMECQYIKFWGRKSIHKIEGGRIYYFNKSIGKWRLSSLELVSGWDSKTVRIKKVKPKDKIKQAPHSWGDWIQ